CRRALRSCSNLQHPFQFFSSVPRSERGAMGRSGGTRLCFAHNRQPSRKSLAFWPARQRGGSASSLVTLPPAHVSSGRGEAVRRSTTSTTRRCHFFLPSRSRRPPYFS